MSDHPVVSLVMKVYNGDAYLKEAIDSILSQTFEDFELLIINDASKDSSKDIIMKYRDQRIRYLENESNMGLCATQNKVINAARGKYIAVMDCDDISYPTRFEKQVAYLDTHPEVILCGTQRNNLVDGKEIPFREIYPLENVTLRYSMVFGQYFLTHSSIMFRAKEYRENGFSYGGVPMGEDYKIMVEMAQKFDIAILPERLVAYRIYPQSVSNTKPQGIKAGAAFVRCCYLDSIQLPKEEKNCLRRYFEADIACGEVELFLKAVHEMAKSMGADISKKGNAYPITCEIVQEYLMKQSSYDMKLWYTVRQSQFADTVTLKKFFGWKLLAACFLRIKRR